MSDSIEQPENQDKRKALSKKTRFEIFKRDKFTCGYCGLKAPEVVLQVDHIHPVSKGGENDLLNLVTACSSCNAGKSDRTLDDQSIVERQRRQLEELQAKREQIDMMIEWQTGLALLPDHALDQVCEFYTKLVPGLILNDAGRASLRQILQANNLDEVLEELRKSTSTYIRVENGKVVHESAEIAWRVFQNRCRWLDQMKKDPIGSELRYIRGMMRKRYQHCPMDKALFWLTEAYEAGISFEKMKSIVYRNTCWTAWVQNIDDQIKASLGQKESES